MKKLLLVSFFLMLSGCEKEVFSIQYFVFPESYSYNSKEWVLVSEVQIATSDKGGFSTSGNREVRIYIKNRDGDLLQSFKKSYRGEFDLDARGKWINANTFEAAFFGTDSSSEARIVEIDDVLVFRV